MASKVQTGNFGCLTIYTQDDLTNFVLAAEYVRLTQSDGTRDGNDKEVNYV